MIKTKTIEEMKKHSKKLILLTLITMFSVVATISAMAGEREAPTTNKEMSI